jgi:hypothetical protein
LDITKKFTYHPTGFKDIGFLDQCHAYGIILNLTNSTIIIRRLDRYKQQYYPVIAKMEEWEPHDLVKPDSWFQDENSATEFVYRLLLREVRKLDGKKFRIT